MKLGYTILAGEFSDPTTRFQRFRILPFLSYEFPPMKRRYAGAPDGDGFSEFVGRIKDGRPLVERRVPDIRTGRAVPA